MRRVAAGHLSRVLVMVACVAGVPLAVVILVWWSFGLPIAAFRPFINDEVTYWHQALTFSQAGFGGGYYTSAEVLNPSGFTPFGAHGPGFPVIYGLFGRLFAWRLYSPIVANLFFLGLAAWSCVTLSQAGRARGLLLAALLCTFWPLLIWAPTAMQESLHHAGAIAMAGCVAGVLRPSPSRTARALGWILLTVLGFVRPSWLVLMPVWAVATTWNRARRVTGITVAASLLVSAVVFVAYGRSTAPFVPPFFFLRATSAALGVQAIWDNVRANVALTMAIANYKPLEVLLRVQYWVWLAAAAAVVAVSARAATRQHSSLPYIAAGAVAMAAAMAFMLTLYTLTNMAEHRVLSAFLLFAGVLAALAPGRTGPVLVSVLIASQLAATSPFLHAFKEERQDNFIWDRRGHNELADALREAGVVFHPGAPRWCNTLLTSQFPPFLSVMPAGIGLSVVRESDQLALPLRSRYLLLDDRARAELGPVRMTPPLARLPYGVLYRNLDADPACPKP